MTIKETPNIITAVLKVTATAEFFDDEASEETVRYAIEQDLEDAGFDVDVALLKEQDSCENCAIAIEDRQPVVRCRDCDNKKCWERGNVVCGIDGTPHKPDWFCAYGKRKEGR